MNISRVFIMVVLGAGALVVLFLINQRGEVHETGGAIKPLAQTPEIQELKTAIDELGARSSWNLSSTAVVEQQLRALAKIKATIESDQEVGLLTEADAQAITRYYYNMLVQQLDLGVRQFFQQASYGQHAILAPIYRDYVQVPRANRAAAATLSAVSHYYSIQEILAESIPAQDSMSIEQADVLLNKVQEAQKIQLLSESPVFQELASQVTQGLLEQVVSPYRRRAVRLFMRKFSENKVQLYKVQLKELATSRLGETSHVQDFLSQTNEQLQLFADCAALYARNNTSTLCEFCIPFIFYREYCDNQ